MSMDYPGSGGEPEKMLAFLIHSELGVAIDADKLKAFVVKNWRQIQSAAHSIHNNDLFERGRKFGEMQVKSRNSVEAFVE